MLMHACNLSTQEVNEGRSGAQGQPQQFSEFKTLGDMRPCRKTNKQIKILKERKF